MKAGIPYIYKPGETGCPVFYSHAPTIIPPPWKKRILNQFGKRCLKDVDAKATFNFVPGVGTAFWKNNPDGTLHEICMHEGIIGTISSFGVGNPNKGTFKSHRADSALGIASTAAFKALAYKPGLYGVRTGEHEICHALYTSFDIERLMVTDPKMGGYDGNLANLFEDARIEDLFRQRRPLKNTLDREGTEIIIPAKADGGTYGIRKFDWWMWTGIKLDTPRHVFMAFTMAESYKEITDAIRSAFFDQHGSGKGDVNIDERWYSKHLKRYTGITDVFEFYKRCTFHGHGTGRIDGRLYPKVANAHDLHDMMREFQEIWPSTKDETSKGGNGTPGGRFGDCGEKAENMGLTPENPHNGEAPEEEPEEAETEEENRGGGEETITHDSAGEKDGNKRSDGLKDFSVHEIEEENVPQDDEATDPRGDYDEDNIPKEFPTQYFRKAQFEHLERILNKPWMSNIRRLLGLK